MSSRRARNNQEEQAPPTRRGGGLLYLSALVERLVFVTVESRPIGDRQSYKGKCDDEKNEVEWSAGACWRAKEGGERGG